MAYIDDITIEDAHIIFRNFKGEGSEYNNPGNRNFAVLLDSDVAADLKSIGWNVKYLRPREDDDEPQAYLPVKVKFGRIPPKIVMVNSRSRTQVDLDEDSVSCLDFAEFETIDLIIRPYQWERQGKSGISAYLKTGYFTIMEDPFAHKYDYGSGATALSASIEV